MDVTCDHPKKATGVLHLDLGRQAGKRGLYTARLSVTVCAACWLVALYADAPRSLCDWLAGQRGKPL